MLLLNPGDYNLSLGFNFLIIENTKTNMGRTRKDPAKKYRKPTNNKDVPNDDVSFIRMNATQYLAYLRHEKKAVKKEKEEED